ncbi:hypothetical protein JCM11491_002107 [Sporobolomyces phaffii]
MAAAQTLALASPHSDLITSLLFSPQSTHLATCSLDAHIRIVQRNPVTNVYDLNPVIFKAHDGPVLALAWGPPQLGLVLASGGVDGTVKIWRQPDVSTLSKSSAIAHRPSNPHSSTRHSNPHWVLTATLTEPRGTIRSLGFAPSEFGLKLAAVASDSRLRVWECLDPVRAAEFTLLDEVDLNALPLHPATAGAGASSGFAHANASGSAGGSGGSGGPSHDGGAASTSGVSANSSSVASSSVDGRRGGGGGGGYGSSGGGGTVESDGGWALSWCREHWWGERLAVSSGVNGIIRLFHFPSHAPWSNFLNLYPTRQTLSSATPDSNAPPPSHLPPTSSLNWAPPSGRSFQLVAAGSKDSKVRVYKVFPPTLQGPGVGGAASEGEWTAQLDVELDESIHHPQKKGGNGTGGGGGSSSTSSATPASSALGAAGGSGSGSGGIGATKVEWNVTGTVLSTSGGEDGVVRLWKSTYTGQWRQITSLRTETASGDSMAVDS